MVKLLRFYYKIDNAIDTRVEWLRSLFLLLVRVQIFNIYFNPGLDKFEDMETTVFLFEEEFFLPLPSLLGPIAGVAEVMGALMVLLGIFGRFGAFVTFGVAAVIQYGVGLITNPDYFLDIHNYWMFLSLVVLFFGCGKLSIDNFMLKFIK